MTNTDFVYTTYIVSSPEKVWAAITNPEFLKQYWGDLRSDWKKGSEWDYYRDGARTMGGKVIESVPPRRLVISWAETENKEDVSKVTFEIEQVAKTVCLNVIHSEFKPGSAMKGKVSKGWPLVLSNLKSLLETGKAYDVMACKDQKCA